MKKLGQADSNDYVTLKTEQRRHKDRTTSRAESVNRANAGSCVVAWFPAKNVHGSKNDNCMLW